MALEISVKLVLSEDICHCIVPVLPVNESIVLLVPVHTFVPPLTVPATLVGLTLIVDTDEVSLLQTPLVTTTL